MSDETTTDTIEQGESSVHTMTRPSLSTGVHPDLTAPSIFFHGVTAHSLGTWGYCLSLEVQRPNQAFDGACVVERVHSGVVRCADLRALLQLKHSVDLLVLASEKGPGGSAAN